LSVLVDFRFLRDSRASTKAELLAELGGGIPGLPAGLGADLVQAAHEGLVPTERERLDREVVPKAHDCECRLASLREHECTRVMRSRITPMKKMALSIRNHEKLILNWFKASGRLSSGVVEGFNNKAKLAMRKPYGFRSERIVQLVLYHNLLPEPQHTHRFW
jgi:hypothetical protein